MQRLLRLARKYEELELLRRSREALEAAGGTCFPPGEAVRRKAAFRRIARNFPGALRELDTIAAGELQARALRVRAAWERCAAGLPLDDAWVELVIDFHRTLRATLLAKRRIASRGVGDPLAIRLGRLAAHAGEGSSGGRDTWSDWMEGIRRPPGGRLLDLVWAKLEHRHHAPRSALERRIFGR